MKKIIVSLKLFLLIGGISINMHAESYNNVQHSYVNSKKGTSATIANKNDIKHYAKKEKKVITQSEKQIVEQESNVYPEAIASSRYTYTPCIQYNLGAAFPYGSSYYRRRYYGYDYYGGRGGIGFGIGPGW